MDIGIAFDLKTDFQMPEGAPEDRLAEYDNPKTVEGITQALRELGHSPRALGGGRRLVEQLLADPPELLFNISEGWGGRSREAHVPALAEMLGVPYTHSDPLTQAVTLDKAVAKRLISAAGLPTAPFAIVTTPAEADALQFELPAIAKPAWEGSSMGIRQNSRATSLPELRDKTRELLRQYSQPILVEAFLTGMEVTVTVLGEQDPEVLGIMEIRPTKVSNEQFIYSRELKVDWVDDVAYVSPPNLAPEQMRRVEELALAAFKALGCRDIARIDFRFDGRGVPNFLEANALPGIQPGYSDACIVAEKAGINYTQLIARIVESACKRHGLKA